MASTLRMLVVAIGLISIAVPARATVLDDVRFEALVAASDLVVIARVGGQQVVPSNSGITAREVHTEILVERTLRGLPSRAVIVRQLGDGECSRGERIEDDACLRPGRRVLLFLRTSAGRHAHLALLGYAAFDLVETPNGSVAVPHARFGSEVAPSDPLRVGSPLPLARIEGALAPSALPPPTHGGAARPRSGR